MKTDASSYATKWGIFTFLKNAPHFKCNSEPCLNLSPSTSHMSICLFKLSFRALCRVYVGYHLGTLRTKQDTTLHHSWNVIHVCMCPLIALCVLIIYIISISIIQASPERQNWQFVWKQGEIYFRNVAYAIVKCWQVQTLQARPVGWRPEKELGFETTGSLLAEFPLLPGKSFFYYVGLQPRRGGPPILWRAFCLSQCQLI